METNPNPFLPERVEPSPAPELLELVDTARDYAFQARSENTRKAYQSDWADFTAWCARHRRRPLPAQPETVILYITELARTCKVSTIQRRLATISQAHQAAQLDSPTKTSAVRTVWAGIRRVKGVAPERKAPTLTPDLRRMLETLEDGSLLGIRDRALIVVGFAGAFRRSELVALDVEDLRFTDDGLVVTVRRSKTDQEGAGRTVGLPYGSQRESCPIRTMRAWLTAAGIETGPVFRPLNRHGQMLPSRLSDRAVARVVKRCAEAAGLDPSHYAGHSLRAGLATQAAMGGASAHSIMKQTGHRTLEMVHRYIRDGSLFRDNAAAKTGL